MKVIREISSETQYVCRIPVESTRKLFSALLTHSYIILIGKKSCQKEL